MPRKALAVVVAFVLMSIPGIAAGQATPDGQYPPTFFDFVKGSDISAKVLSPKGILLKPDPRIVLPNLIEYRYDFVPETLTATGDV